MRAMAMTPRTRMTMVGMTGIGIFMIRAKFTVIRKAVKRRMKIFTGVT